MGSVSACGESLSDSVLCGRLSVRYPLVSNFKCVSWSSVSEVTPGKIHCGSRTGLDAVIQLSAVREVAQQTRL